MQKIGDRTSNNRRDGGGRCRRNCRGSKGRLGGLRWSGRGGVIATVVVAATEKPYILLFDTGILEFYRPANVNFPFTDTLSGLQFLSGLQGFVQAAK